MRTVTARHLPLHPGTVLPPVISANGLPRVGEAVRVLCDGTTRLGHVSAVDRERQVLRLLADGLKDREIMMELGIGYDTVRQHAHSCYAKLGMRGRQEAREWVRRLLQSP